MDLDDIYRLTSTLLEGAVCGYAIWRGGQVERALGWIIAVGIFFSWLAVTLSPVRWRGPEYGQFAVDLIVLGCFIAVLRRSRKVWVTWITALQLLTVATHVARLWTSQTLPVGYMFAAQLSIFPMLALLAYGTWTRSRERRTPAGST